MAKERQNYDGLAWEITLGVAGGILLASFVSAIIGAIGLWLYLKGLRVELPPTATYSFPIQAQPQPAPAPKESRVTEHEPAQIVVPGKTVEECKALTGGMINEQFKRCRSTHTEMQR